MTTRRPLRILVLSHTGLILVAMAGCQTLPSRVESRDENASISRLEADRNPRLTDVGIEQAGFTSDLTAEQRINTHYDLARALESQGNVDGAITEYRKAVEAFEAAGRLRIGAKDRAEVHRHVGIALDRMGKFERSEEQYRQARKLAPKDARIWNDAGYSLYLQGRWSEAETLLREAVRLDPSNARILTNHGLALAANGQTDEALEVLTKASGPAAAHANLAYILAAAGKLPEARDQYSRALALQPDLVAARLGLRKLDNELARVDPSVPNLHEHPTGRPRQNGTDQETDRNISHATNSAAIRHAAR